MTEEVQSAQTSTQATAGAAIGVAMTLSIVNMSSPVGIWLIVGLFQMLMLLILTGAFIPKTLREFFSGMNFALLNFDFLPYIKIPYINEFYEWIKFEHNNEKMKDLGINDGSTIVNNVFFLTMLMIFIILHIPIASIYT